VTVTTTEFKCFKINSFATALDDMAQILVLSINLLTSH